MLSSISSSILTVVAVTFSIIMVVLALASQQFSPRILGNFARDPASQNVLSIFIGTFVYSLLVLGRISGTDTPLIPVLSVSIAIFLALVSVGALMYFIDHISKTIRVTYIVAGINRRTVAVLHTLFSEPPRDDCRGTQVNDAPPPPPSEDRASVTASKPGYIQAVDFDELVKVAQEYDLLVQLKRMVGDYVAQGSELLQVWPGTSMSEDLTDRLLNVFEIGITRTLYQDVLFGIRQLVDIALKAISPAVNDPTTAVTCIDALSNILLQAVRFPDPPAQYCDESGPVRVIGRQATFSDMVDLAFNQIRQYARSEVTVTLRLLDVLAEVAQATTEPQRHHILWQHAGMISRGANRGILEPLDRQKINERLGLVAQQVGQQLTGVLLAIDESLLK